MLICQKYFSIWSSSRILYDLPSDEVHTSEEGDRGHQGMTVL